MLDQDAVGFVGVVGSVAPQASLPHDDDVRPRLPNLWKVDAPSGQDVPSEVGHENVAHLEQLQEQVSTFICPHIQGYPLLMPLIIRLPGPPGPSRNEGHLVQNLVGLYLYDLGSHGRQDTTGHRQGHVGSQLDNPYPF